MSRQKRVGWFLVVASGAYIAYVLRTRFLMPGPVLTKGEWVQFLGSIVVMMLGTANVRLAAMRERKNKGLPS